MVSMDVVQRERDCRRESEFRDETERILGRAEWLEEADETILQQVLGQGVSARQVALLAGQPVRVVQRRVRQLIDRLHDPAVLCVLRHQQTWPDPLRGVALRVIVRHCSLRQTARQLRLTLHEVRQRVLQARALIDAEGKSGEVAKW